MTSKLFSAFVVFALVSSSSQEAFKEDLQAFLNPWMNAAFAALPLVQLIYEEEQFLEKETVGMSPGVLNPLYVNSFKEMNILETKAVSAHSKTCIRELKSILKTSSERFQTDAYCLKMQQVKVEQIILLLMKVIFPVAPTKECPIPVLCNLSISLSPRNIRDVVNLLRELQKHITSILEFVVYFKRDITQCRKDPEPYNRFAGSITKVATLCVKNMR